MSILKRIVFILALFVVAVVNIIIYWNQRLYYKAEEIEKNEKKIEILEKAYQFYPSNDLVFYELGKAFFDLGIRSLSDETKSSAYLQESIKNFKRSVRINPASQFSHFNLGQSILYMSFFSPSLDVNCYDEYKKAAVLVDHNSEIFYDVGKIFLSRWSELSEENREFTYISLSISFKLPNKGLKGEMIEKKEQIRGIIYDVLREEIKKAKEIPPLEKIKAFIIKRVNSAISTGKIDDVYITQFLAV